MATSEDVLARFAAYGWHTGRVADGTDLAAIEAAVAEAVADPRPSLVAVRTTIGHGSPNRQGSQKAHGAPLGHDEVRLTKEAYGWDPEHVFHVPDEVAGYLSRAILYGEELVGAWERRMDAYRAAHPVLAKELERRLDGGALRRRGGPGRVQPHGREGRRRPDRGRRGQERAVRRPRARDGSDGERDRIPRRVHPVRRDVPHLQRLHARGGPRRRARRPPRRVRVDARLRGAGRGRPHAPAGGAGRGPARDAGPPGAPAGGRERDGCRVGGRSGPNGRSHRARAHAAEGAHARDDRRAGSRRRRPRRIRRARRAAGAGRLRRGPGPPVRRDRVGGPPRGGRGRGAGGRGDPCPRGEPPVVGAVRGAARRVPGGGPPVRCAPARHRRGGRHLGSARPRPARRSWPGSV